MRKGRNQAKEEGSREPEAPLRQPATLPQTWPPTLAQASCIPAVPSGGSAVSCRELSVQCGVPGQCLGATELGAVARLRGSKLEAALGTMTSWRGPLSPACITQLLPRVV